MILEKSLSGSLNTIRIIKWSPDGKYLAAGTYAGEIFIWDFENNKRIELEKQLDLIHCLSWDVESKILLSGSRDKHVCFWSISDEKCLAKIDLRHDTILGAKHSPDGSKLALSFRDNTIIVYDTNTLNQIRQFIGHEGFVYGVMWLNDDLLASISNDTTIKLWGLDSGYCKKTFEGHEQRITTFCIKENLIVSGSDDSTIKVWDWHKGELVQTLIFHKSSILGVSISNDKRFLASKSKDGSVVIWRTDEWSPIEILDEKYTSEFSSIDFSPTGNILSTLTNDEKSIRLWRFNPCELLDSKPLMQRKPLVFISYGTCDINFATPLAISLEARGVPVFYAPWDIDYGDKIVDRISDGLESTKAFVSIISPESINRPWVRDEIQDQISFINSGGEKIFMNVRIKPFELPSFLRNRLCLDCFDFDSIELVSAEIARRVNNIPRKRT